MPLHGSDSSPTSSTTSQPRQLLELGVDGQVPSATTTISSTLAYLGYLLRHHTYIDDLFDVFTVSALPTFQNSSPHADLSYNDLLGYMHKISASVS
jgi:hypothetical protein